MIAVRIAFAAGSISIGTLSNTRSVRRPVIRVFNDDTVTSVLLDADSVRCRKTAKELRRDEELYNERCF